MRSAKVAGVVAASVLLTASVGSASAAPAQVAVDAIDAAVPAAATTSTVVAEPASWREGAVAAAGRGATVASRPSRAVTARQVQAAAFVKYANFTLRSKATTDMRGVEPSLYRGKYYRASIEPKRRCIAQRESEGHYDVVNPSGAYRGAYQVSASLARGATWMMLKEHEKLMGERAAKKVLAQLRAKPMNTWPRYWQDAAFHTVANWKYTGSGIAHWAGGRWHC